jgi:hypothetical protein
VSLGCLGQIGFSSYCKNFASQKGAWHSTMLHCTKILPSSGLGKAIARVRAGNHLDPNTSTRVEILNETNPPVYICPTDQTTASPADWRTFGCVGQYSSVDTCTNFQGPVWVATTIKCTRAN